MPPWCARSSVTRNWWLRARRVADRQDDVAVDAALNSSSVLPVTDWSS